jgi:hypothetical protein
VQLVAPAGLWHALSMRSFVRLATTLLVLGFTVFAGTEIAQARRGGRTSFRDKTAGIQIFLPATWKRQMRSAFPGVLATFRHQTHDARFILAAKRRKTRLTLMALVKQNTAVLRARKWQVGKITATQLGKLNAVEFIATNKNSTLRIRQLYALRQQFAYVMTLITPLSLAVRLRTDFLYVQKSARFAR